MVSGILTAAAIQHRRNRFASPPALESYAVWMDDIETDGADGMPPRLFTHNVTIELYEYRPDSAAEAAIEAAMGAAGVHWSKQDRYYLQSEKLYQVIYEFSYTEKRRG